MNLGDKYKDKHLLAIPFLFVIEMIKRKWIFRQNIIWEKKSYRPESCNDRFTNNFENIFFFSKKKNYFFEKQYIAYSESYVKDKRIGKVSKKSTKEKQGYEKSKAEKPSSIRDRIHQKGLLFGANKPSVWKINKSNTKLKHHASYPPELCFTPIKASCPKFVCVSCGKPRMKIYGLPLGTEFLTKTHLIFNRKEGSWRFRSLSSEKAFNEHFKYYTSLRGWLKIYYSFELVCFYHSSLLQ